MKVAVIGGGIAGTTSAFLLAEQGHDVCLFEQAPAVGSVGAGILLQPSGQFVLQKLGLLQQVLEKSAKIDSLHAQHRSGRTLVHLEYRKLRSCLFGLGVHRASLFQILVDRCATSGVTLHLGQRITEFARAGSKVVLRNDQGNDVETFDLVVAADGSRSALRQSSRLEQRIREYDFAALWTTGPFTGNQTQLLQLVDRDGRLVGILPIGNGRASFFWGIRKSEQDAIRKRGLEAWKQSVAEFHAPATEILSEITSLDQVAFATYRTATMSNVVAGSVVFVGDAAHPASPHLGQGANLALMDAVCLSEQVASTPDLSTALKRYAQERASTTRFYSRLTEMLTPFFQTDSLWRRMCRDTVLPLMPNLPYVGRQMVVTLAGLKTGWFTESV